MTRCGPRRSRIRPIGTLAAAETRRVRENAPVVALADQPVSAVMRDRRTGKA
jgi:hypothetical protein